MSILVLDVGTTSMRGILYDEKGRKISACQLPNHVRFGADGEVSESPSDWKDNTTQIMKTIAEDRTVNVNGIEAIAITSQRSSIIPVNASGEPLLDTIMWQDTRNRSICRELSVHDEECFAKTGAKVNTVFSGSKMTWVRHMCPGIYSRVYRFVNIPEYINFVITGEYCSDYTYASRSGLMNLPTKAWDSELLRLYDVEADKLNRLIEPGEICGRVSAAFSKETGIPEQTKVIHAGGDQQCAAVGLGVTRNGNVSVVLGTGGFLITACDEIPAGLESDVICNCSAIAGKYVIEANVLACSAAYDWFIREFYGMKEPDYQYIEEQLAGFPGITSVLAVPYLKGRGVPDWNADAKAAFAGMTLATTRQELFKSLMESVFLEIKNQIGTFQNYVKPEKIMASGGLTKSRVLGQLLADVLGLPVEIRDDKESTAWGAYLVARTGLKQYASTDDAFEQLTGRNGITTYSPDIKKYGIYCMKQQRMNAYYMRNL